MEDGKIGRIRQFDNGRMDSSNKIRNTKFKTREVKVGKIYTGGKNPVRIQSMTNTNTVDIGATVSQTQLLADAGCEME